MLQKPRRKPSWLRNMRLFSIPFIFSEDEKAILYYFRKLKQRTEHKINTTVGGTVARPLFGS